MAGTEVAAPRRPQAASASSFDIGKGHFCPRSELPEPALHRLRGLPIGCKRAVGQWRWGLRLALSQLPLPAPALALLCAGPLNSPSSLPLTHRGLSQPFCSSLSR